jgi:predicted DNA-binding protein (MmcQ/YjbR family)
MDAGEKALAAVLAYAMSLPETREDFPWGERVVKVGKKVFVFLGHDADSGFGMSVKLPRSRGEALKLKNAEPTGYGLGKAGWVSLQWADAAKIPVPQICRWIEESYRAVAPKTLVAKMGGEVLATTVKAVKKKRTKVRR